MSAAASGLHAPRNPYAVAAHLMKLSCRAEAARKAANLTDTSVEVLLNLCADRCGDSYWREQLGIDLRVERGSIAPFIDHPQDGAHYRAVVAILDEALAALRGLA